MFASLRERNYRYYAGGQVVSLTGTWMQRTAQDWLVLELSGGSAVALGIAVALQFVPSVLFTLWAGVLADRFDKRRLLVAMQAAMGGCGLLLGLLDLTGVVALWHVYVLAFLLGSFAAVDGPIRQSFVMEMVGKRLLTNAVALNSMTFNLARVVGPAVGGVLITLIGTGWVFAANGLSSAAVVAGLLAMNPARLYRNAPQPKERGQLRAGLRYVRSRPDLVMVLAVTFVVGSFGMNFESVLAIMATEEFRLRADGFGLLMTALAIGTFSGASLAARRTADATRRLRLVFLGAAACGALEIGSVLMPTALTFGLALVPVGIAVMTFTTSANSTLQLAVEAGMRGRVMGLYMLVFFGGKPLGSYLAGWLAEVLGARAPLAFGGAVTLLAAVISAAVLRARFGRITPLSGEPG